MTKIAVVGAGPMGLATCYHLLKMGHDVTLYEADKIVGGMSASFNFDGLKIERYYHFICSGDEPLFELMQELDIDDKLRWTNTKMGYYYDGENQDWGEPIALLKFPNLDIISKIRYGLLAFTSSKRNNWKKLDSIDAVTWLHKWVGKKAYNILWRPLFDLKFYQYTSNLSAAWIWSRLKRLGSSRENIFKDRLGYIDGGSDTFLYAISAAIESMGGNIKLGQRVEKIVIHDKMARAIVVDGTEIPYEKIVSTIPMPYVPDILPDLPESTLAQYRSIENIAVVCVLAKLKRPLTKYFWLNISDPSIDIPGVVEYTNLCPLDDHVVYAPYYMPGDHPKYQESDEVFTEKVRAYLKLLNPELTDDDIITIKAGRYRYAQPICEPEFLKKLPPISPGIKGLLVADTSYYYPEDRSMSESVKLGKKLAQLADEL